MGQDSTRIDEKSQKTTPVVAVFNQLAVEPSGALKSIRRLPNSELGIYLLVNRSQLINTGIVLNQKLETRVHKFGIEISNQEIK